MTTEQIIEQAKARRKAAGLHVRIEGLDGQPFDYYPSNQVRKADFLRRVAKNDRKVLEA